MHKISARFLLLITALSISLMVLLPIAAQARSTPLPIGKQADFYRVHDIHITVSFDTSPYDGITKEICDYIHSYLTERFREVMPNEPVYLYGCGSTEQDVPSGKEFETLFVTFRWQNERKENLEQDIPFDMMTFISTHKRWQPKEGGVFFDPIILKAYSIPWTKDLDGLKTDIYRRLDNELAIIINGINWKNVLKIKKRPLIEEFSTPITPSASATKDTPKEMSSAPNKEMSYIVFENASSCVAGGALDKIETVYIHTRYTVFPEDTVREEIPLAISRQAVKEIAQGVYKSIFERLKETKHIQWKKGQPVHFIDKNFPRKEMGAMFVTFDVNIYDNHGAYPTVVFNVLHDRPHFNGRALEFKHLGILVGKEAEDIPSRWTKAIEDFLQKGTQYFFTTCQY